MGTKVITAPFAPRQIGEDRCNVLALLRDHLKESHVRATQEIDHLETTLNYTRQRAVYLAEALNTLDKLEALSEAHKTICRTPH